MKYAPAELLPALLAGLPSLLEDVADELASIDPSYAEFLRDRRHEVLGPAEYALAELVAEGEGPASPNRSSAGGGAQGGHSLVWAIFTEVGRDQQRRDLPLGALMSAFGVGGRIGWRFIATTALELKLPPQVLARLAEAVFALVEELGAASTTGYMAEQLQAAATQRQLRETLAERLLSDRADSTILERAARAAGWPLPAEAAVIFVQSDDERGREALARIDPAALPLRHTDLPGIVVPDPDGPGRRAHLVDTLCGTSALIGGTVPLDQLPESARVAQAAALILDGNRPGAAPLFVMEHLDALIVHRDRRLLAALRDSALQPLAAAAPASREALRQTLRSWLLTMGDRRAMAAELGIHPQTVRYRLGRLHELFGTTLDDPTTRMKLVLALGWESGPSTPVSPLAAPTPLGVSAPRDPTSARVHPLATRATSGTRRGTGRSA